MATHVF
jgi:hypothetical protein